MTDRPCETCGHPITMGMCWRLTCPTRGARESFGLVRDKVEHQCAERGRQAINGTLPLEEPDQEFML